MTLFLFLLLLDCFLLGLAFPGLTDIERLLVTTILYGTSLYGLQYHGAKIATKLIKRYGKGVSK